MPRRQLQTELLWPSR